MSEWWTQKEDRHEEEARDLLTYLGVAPRKHPVIARVAAALRERDAKLEQAEAERDREKRVVAALEAELRRHVELIQHNEEVIRTVYHERDALIAAIQRGYCPDGFCGHVGEDAALLRFVEPTLEHSPDCRVAPLLGGGKE